MTSEEWKQRRFENWCREIRLQSQIKNNALKPKLNTKDVLETADFTFSPIRPFDRVGDSGNLLLTKRKVSRREQYLVKHEFCDCAANEFIYSKLACAMELHIPESKLFHISEGEKRKYFKTGYTVGARYLTLSDPGPSYELIRSSAVNWEEYFSFWALYLLFLESDSFEVVLNDENYIYRVDTTAAFHLGDWQLSKAGLDIDSPNGNIQQLTRKMMLDSLKEDYWEYNQLEKWLADTIDKYGEESRKGFLAPFYEIQGIQESYIDDFLNTLCYFYPDFVGDCYKQFIKAAQKKSHDFLQAVK